MTEVLRIVVLAHPNETKVARQLVAALRRLVDLDRYEVTLNEPAHAFGDRLQLMRDSVLSARAVLLAFGAEGLDREFENLLRADVQLQVAERGNRFGRLLMRLPGAAEVPPELRSWVPLDADDWHAGPGGFVHTPARIVEMLRIQPQWSDGLDLEAARDLLDEPLAKEMVDVAQHLADGKPLTLMLSPYAAVEGIATGNCPSVVRDALVAAIQDDTLRGMLGCGHGRVGPPLLWQDHLATLCLMSGCTREDVAATIEQAVRAADGDERGTPSGQFHAAACFVGQLANHGLASRCTGSPAITLISVCAGLRMERALVAHGCGFERVALTLGDNFRPQLHHRHYVPHRVHRQRASSGEPRNFMPDGDDPPSADNVAFVRLIKPFGSRDLDRGVPSGDLAQWFDLIGHLAPLLQRHVGAATSGPYVVLGGGLGTPQLQAAHSVLLRTSLEGGVRRPRLAIVPTTHSPDPMRLAETQERLARITGIPNSGFDRLKVMAGDPVRFLEALTLAFGGRGEADADSAGPTGPADHGMQAELAT